MSTIGLHFSCEETLHWGADVLSLGMEPCHRVCCLLGQTSTLYRWYSVFSKPGLEQSSLHHRLFCFISCKGKSPTNWLHQVLNNPFTPELQSKYSQPLQLLKGHALHLMEKFISGRVSLRKGCLGASQLLLKTLIFLHELFLCNAKRVLRRVS